MRAVLKKLLLIIPVLALLTLTGCLSKNIDELLSLPQPSEEYIDLQNKIDEIISSGASYSAPASGSYRQSVQLYDINGDGTNEALAFFNVSGEKPLKIYIFSNNNGKYETSAVIDGDGAEIESISYADMNGDGWAEIIVGWKMSDDLQMLNIYSLRGYVVSSVAATDYTDYVVDDINSDGLSELLVIRHDSHDYTGSVIMYALTSEGETLSYEARLSEGSETLAKVTTGKLSDGTEALFVESVYNSTDLITDIFATSSSGLINISASDSALSSDTIRYSTVYCRDINGDGVIEIPIPRTLPAQGDTTYRALDWYSFSRRGIGSVALTTYHNYSDSWYLVLPETWGDNITIRREDAANGERAVVFSIWNGADKPVTDFLKIYALSGENREDAATRGNRQILKREDEVIYSAELLIDNSKWKYMVDYQYLRDNFYLIYSEWITGLA